MLCGSYLLMHWKQPGRVSLVLAAGSSVLIDKQITCRK